MPVKKEQNRRLITRRIKRVQDRIVGELRPGQRNVLKGAGFSTRPILQQVDTSQGAFRWKAPGPPVVARVSGQRRGTVVRVDANNRPVLSSVKGGMLGEPTKPILQHEIGHQLLSARGSKGGLDHSIIPARGNTSSLRGTGTRTPSQERKVLAKGRSPQKQSTSITVRGGSLRAAHHSPSEKRRKDARALSNKMQFRLRKAGRDF